MSEIDALRQIVDELAMRLTAIEEGFALDHFLIRRRGFSPSEAIVLALLLRRQVMTRAAVMTVLYGAEPDQAPDIKIVDQWIFRVRKKLAKFAFGPDTIRVVGTNGGFYIAPSLKTAIDEWLSDQAA